MIKKSVVFVCGIALWCTSAMAGLKVNCGDIDIYGNVTCNQYCEDCAESKCVLAGKACRTLVDPIDPIGPVDPITPTACTAGQFKLTLNKFTTCRDCPSDSDNGGAPVTSALGSTEESDCYIPSGSSFTDGTGSGTFTGNCHYVSLTWN